MPTQKELSPEVLKRLTEAEIQQRLYGQYRGPRRSPQPVVETSRTTLDAPASFQPPAVSLKKDSQWTGEEILMGELKSLRQELILLRRERERLAWELLRRGAEPAVSVKQSSSPVAPATPVAAEVTRIPKERSRRSVWPLVGKLASVLVLIGLIAVPVGSRLLQASPMVSDPSPLTIQVAVYDARVKAEAAMNRLKGLGYDAFLLPTVRRGGRSRYRIYVGRFVTKEEARQERLRLAGDPRLASYSDAFVRIR